MRYLLIVPLFSILVLSCKQHETSGPPELPAFTCGDTTDDGKFEQWNSDERAYLLPTNGRTTYTIGDTMVSGYIKKIDGVSRTIPLATGEFTFRAIYDTATSWDIQFVLVDNVTHRKEGFGYTSRSSKPDKYDVIEHVVLISGTGLTPGCKRLYYYAGTVALHDPTRAWNGQTDDYNMDIMFKGHYDVEVN
jgi:hypothetical protein